MAANNTIQFATKSSAYLDSLINYVLDVKPYHTKLAASAAVAEGYQFSDSINVHIVEDDDLTIIQGADLLPAAAIPGGGRARISKSWWRDIISDGSTYTWPLPLISVPIFADQASLQNFTVGVNDYTGIAGLPTGAFNPQRWDGPGITDVQRNGVHQQDTIDYVLSYGVYSVNVKSGNFIESNQAPATPIPAFVPQSGALAYDSLALENGTVTHIVPGTYEEWTITTTFVDNVARVYKASVVGSTSGNIGTATFSLQTTAPYAPSFSSPEITFLWTFPPEEIIGTITSPSTTFLVGETITQAVTGATATVFALVPPGGPLTIDAGSVTGVPDATHAWTGNTSTCTFAPTSIPVTDESTVVGDTWVITPAAKITVSPGAPAETWSLIKTNPLALEASPTFIPGAPRADIPSIEIHTRSLDRTTESVLWTLTFKGDGTYTLQKVSVGSNYILTIDLVNGCSFSNADVAYTLIPTATGWNAGDSFTWTVSGTVNNFKVYGSVSGWQADAAIGKWYWNGFIGFKIPKLTYSPATSAISALGAIAAGSGYTNGSYTNVPLIGGTRVVEKANITVTSGGVSAVSLTEAGSGYTIGDILSALSSNIGGTGSGFSIPVATVKGINFTTLGPVNSVAEPSVYTITWTSSTSGSIPAKASVFNNIYGYREGLIQGQPWGYVNTISSHDPAPVDELVAFQIDAPNSLVQRNVGDTPISIYIAPQRDVDIVSAYDLSPYDSTPYDAERTDILEPFDVDAETFPLYHGHGAVIWFKPPGAGVGTKLHAGDSVVINKSFTDAINLQIAGASMFHPELGATASDWIPIKLRYFDNVDPNSASFGTFSPTSVANYSDLALYAQGFTAADPTRLVFSILSPRYLKTDRTASSTLVFDQNFFTTYLPFHTHYSIQVQPDQSYGQHARLKFTENLNIEIIHV